MREGRGGQTSVPYSSGQNNVVGYKANAFHIGIR